MTIELKHHHLQFRDKINFLRDEPTTSGEPDDFLCCRMAMLGLDHNSIESGDRETFDKIKRRCRSCEFRDACAVDLKRDPNNPVWASYCPNSGMLHTLTEAWWVDAY
jgi:hypothetical protein